MIFRFVGQVCMKSLLLSIPIACMKFRRVRIPELPVARRGVGIVFSSPAYAVSFGCVQVCRRHIAVASLSFDTWRVRENSVGLTVESLQAMLGRVNSVHSLKVTHRH
jgi:hypothetical protein